MLLVYGIGLQQQSDYEVYMEASDRTKAVTRASRRLS